jgi:hypothetical protein
MHVGRDLDHVVQPLGAGAGRVARGDRTMDGRHGPRGGGRRTPRPNALPIAVMGSPTCTVEESPSVTVARPDALSAGGAPRRRSGRPRRRLRWRSRAGDRDLDARGALDHVVVRQDLAVGREHHAGAAPKGRSPSAPNTCWDVLMSTTVPTGVAPVEPEELPEGDNGTVAPWTGSWSGRRRPPLTARRLPTSASDTSMPTSSAIHPRARCGPAPTGEGAGVRASPRGNRSRARILGGSCHRSWPQATHGIWETSERTLGVLGTRNRA